MHTYWTSMFWSIDSCQNRVPADQYHLTVSRAQVSTHRRQVFFEVIRWQVTSFQVIAGSSSSFFKIHMKYVVFMCYTIKILIANWPRTRKFRKLLQAGKTVAFDFSHHGHALVTLYVQFLCSDWSKFDRWVHAENLCSILNLFILTAEADRVLCQLVMFLTVFFHWMCKMKFSCYQDVLCYSWLVVYWVFGWGIRRLSKLEIRFRMASFSFSPCLMRKRIAKSEAILAFLDTFQELHLEW